MPFKFNAFCIRQKGGEGARKFNANACFAKFDVAQLIGRNTEPGRHCPLTEVEDVLAKGTNVTGI